MSPSVGEWAALRQRCAVLEAQLDALGTAVDGLLQHGCTEWNSGCCRYCRSPLPTHLPDCDWFRVQCIAAETMG